MGAAFFTNNTFHVPTIKNHLTDKKKLRKEVSIKEIPFELVDSKVSPVPLSTVITPFSRADGRLPDNIFAFIPSRDELPDTRLRPVWRNSTIGKNGFSFYVQDVEDNIHGQYTIRLGWKDRFYNHDGSEDTSLNGALNQAKADYQETVSSIKRPVPLDLPGADEAVTMLYRNTYNFEDIIFRRGYVIGQVSGEMGGKTLVPTSYCRWWADFLIKKLIANGY